MTSLSIGELLTPEEAARVIGCTPATLAKWRSQNEGPAFYKPTGKRVVYALREIEAWLESRSSRPNRNFTSYDPPAVDAGRLERATRTLVADQGERSRLYFVTAPSVGKLKIGITRSVANRFSCLQVASPVPLELICSIPGGREMERALHSIFGPESDGGEWFRISPTTRAFLDRLTVPKGGTAA